MSPLPMARTTAATGAGPLGRNHQRKPGLGLVGPLLLPLAHLLKPLTTANAMALSCGGLRGGVARNGRNAARASGRDGPFQLRIGAGDAACVLTRGLGAFEVWLCLRRVTKRARQIERNHQVLIGSGTLEREVTDTTRFAFEWASRFESRPVGLSGR